MTSEKYAIPCRILVCFLACLVLFWAVAPPLHASATEVAATAAVVGINPTAAIAGILLCLGVAYVGSGGFDDLVASLSAALPADYMISVSNNLYVEGITYEDTVYVSEALVKWVQGVLFDADNPVIQKVASGFQSDSLYQSSVRRFRTIYDYYNDVMIANAQACRTFLDTCDRCIRLMSSTETRYYWVNDYTYDSEARKLTIHGPWLAAYGSVNQSGLDSTGDYVVDFEFTSFSYRPMVFGTFQDLVLWEAAPDLDDDDYEEYEAWKARRLFRVIEGGDGGEDPDGDKDGDEDQGLRVLAPYYPVPATENAENLPVSQILAWAGNREADPEDDPVTEINQSAEVSLDPNFDPNVDPTPDPDPDPNPEPSLNPSPEPDLDIDPSPNPQPNPDLASALLDPFNFSYLRYFFPFCIPFDLYDMLAAFVAEPEAPVFTFATGYLGKVFTVEIDLSPWDGVAKTVRAIQLCICIVGLAFATRKFIKW